MFAIAKVASKVAASAGSGGSLLIYDLSYTDNVSVFANPGSNVIPLVFGSDRAAIVSAVQKAASDLIFGAGYVIAPQDVLVLGA